MVYTKEEQIKNAEEDLKDDLAALQQAEKDLVEATKWRDKVKGWVEERQAKLKELKSF